MSPDTMRPTRRTEGLRPHGRSERVVEAVLLAATEELTRVGYAALRIEDVATRSGVNKTTIYRRWSTKADLVAAAIQQAWRQAPLPDTGSLRDDLRTYLQLVVMHACSPVGSGLIRVIHTERTHPELEPVIQALRTDSRQLRLARIQRAIDCGELPAGTDAALIGDLVFAPVFTRACNGLAPADDAFIDGVLQVVLTGAGAHRH